MRLVIAMRRHETNTFSPVPTPFKSFAHASGMDAPVSGFISARMATYALRLDQLFAVRPKTAEKGVVYRRV